MLFIISYRTHRRAYVSVPIKAFSAWHVDVTLNFQNFGPDTVLQIGFPFDQSLAEADEEESPPDPGFVTYVDGTKVPVVYKKGIQNPDLKDLHYPHVFTSEIAFKSGEKKSIRHTYNVGGTVDSMGGMDFRYILKTGALWKGVIERVDVFLSTPARDMADLQCISPAPQKVERKGNDITLSWTMLNLKPEADIVFQRFFTELSRMSPDQLFEEVLGNNKSGFSVSNACMSEYFRNRVLATYGYPFAGPYEHALFYGSGQFKENPQFSWNKVTEKHRSLLNFLNDNSKQRITIPKPWYRSNVYIGAGAALVVLLLTVLFWLRRNKQK
ncbi:hypothetical protein OR1_00155 [Geobacter sp. OR-1]|uniref:hypothetical protein n=1 Tax=Geobacter sp. OR-1 TaxID=1266765 RepID=UPI000543CAA8|nr:hypothetical protein [Geobacter sp. OR-1]GAM07886.1 hypothetical protein OR1_00155 [Geobacter sp. OR-1]